MYYVEPNFIARTLVGCGVFLILVYVAIKLGRVRESLELRAAEKRAEAVIDGLKNNYGLGKLNGNPCGTVAGGTAGRSNVGNKEVA